MEEEKSKSCQKSLKNVGRCNIKVKRYFYIFSTNWISKLQTGYTKLYYTFDQHFYHKCNFTSQKMFIWNPYWMYEFFHTLKTFFILVFIAKVLTSFPRKISIFWNSYRGNKALYSFLFISVWQRSYYSCPFEFYKRLN